MGLHLNYTLQLAGSATSADAMALVTVLHQRAQTLPLALVSRIVHAEAERDTAPDQAAQTITREARIVAEVAAELDPDEPAADPATVIGFLVHPGRGSESATFALMRRHTALGEPVDWYWRWHCKTQYASVVSDAHLVSCHLALVDLLDTALQCGLTADVRDETQYWETRDTAVLLREVHKMNRIVAAFAGRLSDAMGPQLQAPIFEHPQFEHLEMPGGG